MNGPEDAFPYNSIIRESDLLGCKESDLIEYTDNNSYFRQEENELTIFDFVDEESMNKINKNEQKYIRDIAEMKETDLTNVDNDIREIDISGIGEIKETDLTGGDDFCERMPFHGQEMRGKSYSISSEQSSSYHHDDEEQWHLDNAESVSLSTDSGIINDKMNLDLDFGHLNSAIKFQDLESDFFETDCDTIDDNDRSPTEDCFETNRGETKDLVRFQDIESDFFETDCEGVDLTHDGDNAVKFQDIESDFFDEEDEISPFSLALKNKQKAKISSKHAETKRDTCEISQQKQILTRLTSNKEKRSSMTNNLLRTTIEELERALSNSNTLLVKRDQKIHDLRKHNNELKKSLSEELENSAQMNLLLLEKEAVVSEKEAAIVSLQTDIERLNSEISDLRLYKVNNYQDYSISCDPSKLDDSVETDLLGDQDTTNTLHLDNKHSTACMQRKDSGCSSKTDSLSPCRSKYQSIKHPDVRNASTPKPDMQQKNSSKSGSVMSRSPMSPTGIKTRSPASPMSPGTGKNKNPDNLSSSELHARLQMKFMRDAFFYYMIGFHSDEQINAILAILDYGDKRQDFVLEAHKLKKNGKKFNVSKVSTRELTFVQDIEPK